MEITIKNNKYKLKFTLRAMIIFEKITKKAFSLDNLTDQIVFFYALILANDTDTALTLDELIDEIDRNPQLLTEYYDFLKSVRSKEKLLGDEKKAADKKKA